MPGSGKSTIGNALLGLVKPTAGTVPFEGQDIASMSAAERRSISGRLQVVFQDPYSSLNPSRRVGQIISEPLGVHIPKASRGNSTRPGARLTGPLRSAP